MPLAATSVIMLPVLCWVAISDLLWRRIGNRPVLVLLLAWIALTAWRLSQGLPAAQRAALGMGTGVGALVLVAGYGLFTMHWMGAGDAKLMAVMCLWAGDRSLVFLLAVSLIGGVLALALPLLHGIEKALALALLRFNVLCGRAIVPIPSVLQGDAPRGLPYGIAIALGAACVFGRGAWT